MVPQNLTPEQEQYEFPPRSQFLKRLSTAEKRKMSAQTDPTPPSSSTSSSSGSSLFTVHSQASVSISVGAPEKLDQAIISEWLITQQKEKAERQKDAPILLSPSNSKRTKHSPPSSKPSPRSVQSVTNTDPTAWDSTLHLQSEAGKRWTTPVKPPSKHYISKNLLVSTCNTLSSSRTSSAASLGDSPTSPRFPTASRPFSHASQRTFSITSRMSEPSRETVPSSPRMPPSTRQMSMHSPRLAPSTRPLPDSSPRLAPSTRQMSMHSPRLAPSTRPLPDSSPRLPPTTRQMSINSPRLPPTTRQMSITSPRIQPTAAIETKSTHKPSEPTSISTMVERTQSAKKTILQQHMRINERGHHLARLQKEAADPHLRTQRNDAYQTNYLTKDVYIMKAKA
ncbi:hypothetical protein BDF14DRAFT_1403589 [Spinellus fusiger]|nr:hypothetical protein BDF14DRAFT_1403589 [Spinellus fusiger]